MTRFFPIVLPVNELVMCSECAAVVVDDIEGANRADHARWHETVAMLAARRPVPNP